MGSAEEIVKWLMGIFAAIVIGGLWRMVNAIAELRKSMSGNTKELHAKIDANAKEVRDGYVRSSEMAEVKVIMRETNEKLDALIRELIKHRLHPDTKG